MRLKIRAFSYRVLCAFGRYGYLIRMILFTAIPVAIAFMDVRFKSEKRISQNETYNLRVGSPFFLKDYLNFVGNLSKKTQLVLVVSPNNTEVKDIMTAQRYAAISSPPIYFNSKKGVSKFVTQWYRKPEKERKDKKICGINFEVLTSKKLIYEMRTAEMTDEKWSYKPNPDYYPQVGFLYSTYLTFLGLEMSINEAYIRKYQHFDLVTPHANLIFQDLPYAKNYRSNKPSGFPFTNIAIWFGIIFILATFATLIILEKANGVREILKINGAKMWMIYANWFVPFGFVTLVMAISITILWKITYKGEALMSYTQSYICFFVLLTFYWSELCSVAFISSLIGSPIWGILIVIGYWVVSFGIVYYWFLDFTMNNFELVLLALLPAGGLRGCLEAISAYETKAVRLTASSLFSDPPSKKNLLPVGVTLVVMTASMIIYLAFMLYVDRIKPGKYGRAEPWSFILPIGKNKPDRTTDVTEKTDDHKNGDRGKGANSGIGKKRRFNLPFFSKPVPKQMRSQTITVLETIDQVNIGLKTQQLVKMFGKIQALNLSITILKNEITVLLGHNGAGKTTFFSIISGMFSPTSGQVFTENYNIFESKKNIKLFRRGLGYCPQFDVLLSNMTVKQNIIFFGMLKGLKYSEAKKESDRWMKEFKLYDSRDKVPRKLSGGMKRKLCLSIAMTGKPKFLLLDEPTTGLDPESRRDIWNVLIGTRGSTTTIITTHFMEDADVLADHVALMVYGELKCYGTTMFLKQHYGVGYLLNCASADKDAEQILNTVHGFVPSAKLLRKTGKTCSISLPVTEQKKFPSLLKTIGKETDVTLSYTTMDDVFIKVQEDEGVSTTVTDMPKAEEDEEDVKSKHPFSLQLVQQIALLVKRMKWWYYDWKFYIFIMIILPYASCYFAIHISESIHARNARETTKEGITVALTLNTYAGERGYVAKNQSTDPVSTFVESAMTSNGISFVHVPTGENPDKFIVSLALKDLEDYFEHMVFAFDTRGTKPKALTSTLAIHSLPIAYGVMVNYLVKAFNSEIVTFSTPINNIEKGICRKSIINPDPGEIFSPWFIFLIVMLIAASYFIQFPHKERTSGFKHLQIMTGVWPVCYWLPILAVDLLIILLLTALVVLTIVLLDSYNLFNSQLGLIAQGLILYGISSTLMAHVFSFFFKKYTSAVLTYIFVSLFAVVFTFILEEMWSKWKSEYAYFLPWTILSVYIYKISESSYKEGICRVCPEDPELPTCDEIKKPSVLDKEINYFLIDMFIYTILILCMEYGIGNVIMALLKRIMFGNIITDDDTLDPDVLVEKEYIKNIRKKSNDTVETEKGESERENTEEKEPAIFICDSLGKKYSKKQTAVYDVTFGVQEGDCFGLLGTNGAGKSTTFEMLTGLTIPTKGTSEIMGNKLKPVCNTEYLKSLGYCPQQNGLSSRFSARSMITFFGHLRGLPPRQVKTITKQWIGALDMTEISNIPCKNYSGGNKRKLSLAIAMIGNPPVILLDEPTTGVDPVNRRRIWEILRYSLETNKQTIILTSHSMDECEALCGRITIMVKGVMKCIGPIPSLKKNFGKGCVLQVRLKATPSVTDTNIARSEIESKFSPYIQLQDEQQGLLNYVISTETIKIHDMFEMMLRIQSAHETVEDFNLSDLTLEQVFLSFTLEEQAQETQFKVSMAIVENPKTSIQPTSGVKEK